MKVKKINYNLNKFLSKMLYQPLCGLIKIHGIMPCRVDTPIIKHLHIIERITITILKSIKRARWIKVKEIMQFYL